MWKDSRLIPVSLLAFACLAMMAPETRPGTRRRWRTGRWRRSLAEMAGLAKAADLA